MSLGANGPQDLEPQLDRATPRRAPDTLRDAVLAAVAAELSAARPAMRWERRLAWSAASLLVAAVAFNVIVAYVGEARLAALFSADPRTSDGIARSGAALADDRAAWRVAQQMLTMTAAVATPSIRDRQLHHLRQALSEWTIHGGDWVNAQSVEDTSPDPRRPTDSDRGALDHRGHPQLASESPA